MDENKEDIHRPPSESAKEGDNKPLIEKNTHKPIQKQNTSPRWHISSTFFNATNDNPLFYNYDPNNDRFSEFSEHDDQLLGYLEGIKTDRFFPGYFCWIEKIVLIIDFLQIFGLLWITAQPYPWPYLWSIYTQPINVFNLDFFSLTSDGALAGSTAKLISPWGQMDRYLSIYGIFYAGVAFLLSVAMYLLFNYRFIFDSYGKELYPHTSKIFGVLLFISYFMFVPCHLAVFRIYYCDPYDSNALLPVDPSTMCMSSTHAIFSAIYTFCVIPFSISTMYYFYYYVKQNIIYYNAIDHEKKLQIYELLYMFQINETFIDRQIWTLSSFRYFSRYYYFTILLMKLLLVINFIFVRFSYLLQSFIALLIILAFNFYYTLYKLPYRNLNTNLQFVSIMALLIINASYSVCNASGMQNFMTQASTQTLFFIVSHLVFFGAILVLNCYILFYQSIKLDWPAIKTLDRIYHSPLLIPKVFYWLHLLRHIEKIKLDYLLESSEVNNIQLLEFVIQQLRIFFLQAKSVGSIFENIMQDYLEELLWIHSQRAIFSLRKSSHWDQAYINLIQSKVLKYRHSKYILMNPIKRKILLKLLSYYVIRGEGKYSKKFDINVALEYQQNLRLQRELKLQKLKDIYQQKQLKNQTNKFIHFQSDFQALMNEGGEGMSKKTRKVYLEDGTEIEEEYEEELNKFDPFVMQEAKKMIDRLQQRTELALNKHHHAAKAITDQQKQMSLQGKLQNQVQQQIYQETSHNMSVNNIIHQYNQSQLNQQFQQGQSGLLSPKTSMHMKSQLPGGKLTPAGGSSSSLVSGTGAGLVKISTMELIKETVDEEERQDLEELYYLWDEAITLYENEEFPGDYEELNSEVENWYAYRGLVSKRLEVIVKFLQEQLEMLDDLIDEEVEDDFDDDEGDNNPGQSRVDFDESDNGSLFANNNKSLNNNNLAYRGSPSYPGQKKSFGQGNFGNSFNDSFAYQRQRGNIPSYNENDEDYDDEENNYGLVDPSYNPRKRN